MKICGEWVSERESEWPNERVNEWENEWVRACAFVCERERMIKCVNISMLLTSENEENKLLSSSNNYSYREKNNEKSA